MKWVLECLLFDLEWLNTVKANANKHVNVKSNRKRKIKRIPAIIGKTDNR